MNFKRHIYAQLSQWKANTSRKPLLLRGARQVGKTTLVKEFAKSYPFSIHLNLERKDDARYFHDFSDVNTIIKALFAVHSIPILELKNTLLFIDEIQESPEAIALLRYFYEELPELHVIAAGSLLEHVMRKVKSFPVGRVQYLYVHPLNFEEFLHAKNENGALEQLHNLPVQEYAHQLLLKQFHDYAIVGGMPEVVKTYLATNSLFDLSIIYEGIWASYKDDVEKYAQNATSTRVIKHIMNTAHLFVDQRIKFQNFGNSNYRSREVSEAMISLNEARIIQLIYPTTALSPPIIPDIKKSPRLQFLDTGLINHELGIQADMLALEDLNTTFKGAIIPHLIAQEIMSLNTNTYKQTNFWVREKAQSSAEVDMVLPLGDKLIPIEIKSGSAGKLKSLHQFIENVDHPYAIRLYAGAFSVEQHKTPTSGKSYYLMNLPYYLGTKIHDYMAYFVKNYS